MARQYNNARPKDLRYTVGKLLDYMGRHKLLLLLVAVLVLCFGEREQRLRRILEMLPFSLLAALSFLVPYYLLGTFLGPEFASIVGAIAGMFLTVLAARFHILVPKHCWRFRKEVSGPSSDLGEPPTTGQFLLAWTPYLVIALLLFLGMFMETLAIILLATPVLLPVMTAFGVDPIHFGVVLVCCCGVGFSTPPLGENIFIASGIADTTLEDISYNALPFVFVTVGVIILCVFVPDIVLFLPRMMY